MYVTDKQYHVFDILYYIYTYVLSTADRLSISRPKHVIFIGAMRSWDGADAGA
jgi:hypothetical protein